MENLTKNSQNYNRKKRNNEYNLDFILIFNTGSATVIDVPSQQACYEVKDYADSEIKKAHIEAETGCFRKIGGKGKHV